MISKILDSTFFKNNYFIIIPLSITFLIYFISLFYGFRNFDEDLIIKNFYVKKTFLEYLEKYLLVDWSGITEAHGFTFSSIKNVHFCLLERPLFYQVNFFFQANPFLFHALSLTLHLFVVYFFSQLCFLLTQDKFLALFPSLIWSIHPTNIEPIIWACNWPHLLGALLYFYTLKKSLLSQSPISITLLTLIQILIVEHTITIPLAVFFTIIFYLRSQKNLEFRFCLSQAFRATIPAFVVTFIYFLLRTVSVEKITHVSSTTGLNFFERVFFFTPQTFIHQLKLALFPINLTIDQLDLLKIDTKYLGAYHIFCILFFILFLLLPFILKKNFSGLSYGLLLFLIGILPFIQIIPLYSLVAERYNYFGAAFLIFGITTFIFKICRNFNKLFLIISLIICLILGTRTLIRITEWQDSKSLFLSTINTSKSLLKKGIWTYNLALSEPNETNKKELLNLSINLLRLFVENYHEINEPNILKAYELESNSLLAKAALRTATNYEILSKSENKVSTLQLEYLNKALNYSRPNTQVQALIYKDLGTASFQNKEFNKALDYYKKSIEITSSPTLNYAIAVCYLSLKDFLNYEKYLHEAVSVISAYNVSPFKTYGQLLELSKHDYQNAIKYYKIATLLENNVEPYILLGRLYLKLNQIENALKFINRGLYGFPDDSYLLYLHGAIMLNKGKESEGKKDLIKVVEKKDTPNDIKIEACNILVNIFSKQNDSKNVAKYHEIALMIDPKKQSSSLK